MRSSNLLVSSWESVHATPVIPQTKARGFSLVEMMVVVAVIAIILGVAAPAVQSMIAAQRVRNAATELYESLIFARSEAIKRAETVAFDTDGFAGGWKIEVVSSSAVLREQGGFANVSFDPADTDISFNRLGRLGSAVEIEISRTDTANKRCIQVEASGKPRVISGACP